MMNEEDWMALGLQRGPGEAGTDSLDQERGKDQGLYLSWISALCVCQYRPDEK